MHEHYLCVQNSYLDFYIFFFENELLIYRPYVDITESILFSLFSCFFGIKQLRRISMTIQQQLNNTRTKGSVDLNYPLPPHTKRLGMPVVLLRGTYK